MSEATSVLTGVLVMDNFDAVRERLCAAFAEIDEIRTFGCAAAPADALRHLADLQPHCVVIDVPVDGSEGFELLGAVRRAGPSCVLVVVTNHATEEFRTRGLAAGADHILAKSTEIDRLMELVGSVKERR